MTTKLSKEIPMGVSKRIYSEMTNTKAIFGDHNRDPILNILRFLNHTSDGLGEWLLDTFHPHRARTGDSDAGKVDLKARVLGFPVEVGNFLWDLRMRYIVKFIRGREQSNEPD